MKDFWPALAGVIIGTGVSFWVIFDKSYYGRLLIGCGLSILIVHILAPRKR